MRLFFAICCLGFALPAVAQLDSYALHAKYGSPLNRETFHLPAGFDLVVDYGATTRVCKIELPALLPSKEKISNTSEMKQHMYEFLAELVPSAIRGKELQRFAEMHGLLSLAYVEYEHVTISEAQNANQPWDDRITVRFKDYDCQTPPGQ